MTQDGLRMLRDAGLVMQATFPLGSLPPWAIDPMTAAGVEIDAYQSLVLLGQAGTRLWAYIQESGPDSEHPFDEVSRRLAGRFVEEHLNGVRWEVVYPSSVLMPLGALAELAGWGRASPLGLTIHERYGLWLAHRVAFLVDARVPAVDQAAFSHPCDSCVEKPCVAACPVGAVDAVSGFDVGRCAEFRVGDGSVCAYRCLAREACPVGAGYRYGPEQMRHHYASGLESIRRYLEFS